MKKDICRTLYADDCADAGIGKRRHGVHFELCQQVEAMGRWTKTYEAHGRTIEVDVPIIVPEVNEFPVFRLSHTMRFMNSI